MKMITLTLPDSLHERIQQFAEYEQVSVDQFVVSAIAEKVSVSKDFLEEGAEHAIKEKFEQAMAEVPDVEPEGYDRL